MSKTEDLIRNYEARLAELEARRPTLIINAAAYTAVDRAESEPQAALTVNRDGPANLAKKCRDRHIPLIHVSTDYVFRGTNDRPYVETDAPGVDQARHVHGGGVVLGLEAHVPGQPGELREGGDDQRHLADSGLVGQ